MNPLKRKKVIKLRRKRLREALSAHREQEVAEKVAPKEEEAPLVVEEPVVKEEAPKKAAPKKAAPNKAAAKKAN